MARERWSSRTIFLFAAIGSAVGLGNFWRFPFLTYKFGGGAFLVPYLIALLVIGTPLLILEFALGQKLQRGAVGSFRAINSKLGGIGLAAIMAGFIVVVYYVVIMAWSLLFLVKSFQFPLPWAGDSESYFFGSILNISDSVGSFGGINIPLLISLFAVWVAIYFIVWKGVKSVGKVVMITVPLPIILLIVLLIRGITLPGSFSGIAAYLRPDFGALLSTEIWTAAVSQIFFTLSLAFGIMIAYASYNKNNQDVAGDTYITVISNTLISLVAGFVVFSILGYMAASTSVPLESVVEGGPSLAFVVFPQALSLLPWAPLFAVLFFLTLLSLGIDSAFSLVEAANTAISDRYKNPNTSKIAFFVVGLAFLLGILFVTGAGLYFLDIVDHFVTNYTLVIVGIFESIAVGWVYGADRLREYINSVSKIKLGRWWNVSIKYVVPLTLIVLLITQFVRDIVTPYGGYPGWALAIGWLTVIVPVIIGIFFCLTGSWNKK